AVRTSIALKAIDWLAFAERVPPNQRAMFNNLKTRSDAIGAKLSSLPEKPVTIDWSFYKTNVARAGMVAEFESKTEILLGFISCLGGWSQTILQVKNPDVDVLDCRGYTWSVFVRPVGRAAKYIFLTYGIEITI
uniref:Uncharacterized protein n=1 Tax=Hucho hucho TaxID=62062 RepID=A0A4W5KNY3_9TELE